MKKIQTCAINKKKTTDKKRLIKKYLNEALKNKVKKI